MTLSNLELFQRAEINHVDRGHTAIAYRRVGAGKPLILIHGWPLWGATYRNVVPHLSATHDCIVVDLPGTGHSRWTDQSKFGFGDHANAVRAVADQLGLREYGVLAHDTGATVARVLAASDDRVRALVLANTEIPGHRPPFIPLYHRFGDFKITQRMLAVGMRFDAIRRSAMGFGGCFSDLSLLDGEFSDLFIEPLIHDQNTVRGQMKYLLGIDWNVVDDLKRIHSQIHVPVRVVWGVDDSTFPIDLAREMVSQFPKLDGLHEIARAKLLVHEERPEEVARLTRSFMLDVMN